MKRRTGVFMFLYALLVIFAFDSGDFYSYGQVFVTKTAYDFYSGFVYEPIYNWLAIIVNYNYLVWRILIWGGAVLFLMVVIRKLYLKNRNMLIAFVLFGFGLDVYTRGILGHTMLLLGVVLWVDINNTRFTQLMGLLLFCVSYFFHRSMVVNMLFALLAFCPIDKKTYLFSLVAFPFCSFLASKFIAGIVTGNIDITVGEGMGSTAVSYATSEKMVVNVYGVIGKFITIVPEYLTLFYLVNRIVYKKYFRGIKQERVFTYLFRLTYITIYIASSFYFVETSSWIYERFKYMAFFPLPFVLAKIWSLETRSNLWIQMIIILQLFSLMFRWFMKIYSWYGL